ncbi:NifB/NifX family molybdenum-iron cluster-binding protein [Thermosipho atlanticus]|uniref:Predicted Fe-Mo cluster-binding protein, NifX family n=1 Tax=Thermosipho atlanticus DSM 15807 TaxID=1123380 RepID=A0A1M5TY31_9BACT|nr:NifB/NifX family molybdenum-iron cluster-binding protein [Thermosipho atlanticus]SHH55303.1 Predicted Fe-Mo cluster-binding protein, NifX family [Thermosipho atlanticus DSM 15807]
MKIALPVVENRGANSLISEHFGHAPFFAFVKIDEGKIEINIEKNPLEEHNPGEIPEYLKNQGVNLIIVRGIGQRAISFFNQFGIEVIRGANGTVEKLIQQYLEGKLRNINYEVKEKFHKH